jgi:hypothetical protein
VRTVSSRRCAGRRIVSLRPSEPTFSIETCMMFLWTNFNQHQRPQSGLTRAVAATSA